jgi:predicted nucleotidyltransferase component of viral defense system
MSTVAGPNADDEAGREERLLIKGGTAMMLRLGLTKSRFSKDLDAMLRGAISPFIERLQIRGRMPHYGWTFTVAKAETIEVPGMSVKPRRAQVKMAFKGKPYSTVQLEIAAAEGSAAEEFDLLTSAYMIDLGFPTYTIQQQFMTVRYQVAQKLHACTTRSDRPNARAHDLVDIALLADFVRQDPAAVREACVEIFGIRALHPWPPTLTPEPHWPDIYTRATAGLEGVVPVTLEEAVIVVSELIDLVENSTER